MLESEGPPLVLVASLSEEYVYLCNNSNSKHNDTHHKDNDDDDDDDDDITNVLCVICWFKVS